MGSEDVHPGLSWTLVLTAGRDGIAEPGLDYTNIVKHVTFPATEIGDAEIGLGLDLGGGLAWSDPARGLSAEVRGRGLLIHESRGFRERGFSGSLSWEPDEVSGRGPKLTLTQTVGGSASGGVDALLGRATLEGLAASGNGDNLESRRLEARFGYGLAPFGERFTLTPEAGFGLSESGRDYGLGWRLVRRPSSGEVGALDISLEATRRESANDNAAEHRIGLGLEARW